MTIARPLYSPPDTEAAYDLWKCNCGPASVAALLGLTCAGVRHAFPEHGRRGYSNPTHVLTALRTLEVPARSIGARWPVRGLAFVQWGGPWLAPGVPVGAAYGRTHWIAVDEGAVYDVNVGHWVSRSDWEEPVTGVAAWILQHVPKADGTWSVRTGVEVRACGAGGGAK